MFPTNRKIVGYRFGDKTFYNSFHIGCDYANEGDIIYAPFDGYVTKSIGAQGGNTIFFTADTRVELIRFLHCQKILTIGKVQEGDAIGIVGHTGLVSPPGIKGAHTHIDISKNGKLELGNTHNFINPETYNWKGNMAQIKTQGKGQSRRIIIEAADINEWNVLTKIYGKDPNILEEKVKDN